MTHLKGPPSSNMLEYVVKICDFYFFRFFLIPCRLPHTWTPTNRLDQRIQDEDHKSDWIFFLVQSSGRVPILGRLGTDWFTLT